MSYFAKPASPGELMHYGIKGMKWGVRRGGLKARYAGALADRNQQKRAILTRRLEGRSKGIEEKIASGWAFFVYNGRKGRDQVTRMQLNNLQMQKNRIKKGELKARDYLEMAGHIGIFDLTVSRRDARG